MFLATAIQKCNIVVTSVLFNSISYLNCINDQVLLGSMGALSLMTVFSVIIGRIFHSVPAQFQTSKFDPRTVICFYSWFFYWLLGIFIFGTFCLAFAFVEANLP